MSPSSRRCAPRTLNVLHEPGNDHGLAVTDRVDVDLGPEQVAIDEHGTSTPSALGGSAAIAASRYRSSWLRLCTISIARPPSTYEGRTRTGKPISSAIASASSRSVSPHPAAARWSSERINPSNRAPILGEVDARDAAPEDVEAGAVEGLGEVHRGLATELHDHPRRLLLAEDRE